jgi:ribonuclease HI
LTSKKRRKKRKTARAAAPETAAAPPESPLQDVTIFTDGACIFNPGPGGYGVILVHGDHRKELSAGFRRTTNNRMEMMAAIAGIEALKRPCRVRLYSDSQYLVNAIELGWARRWQAHAWWRNRDERALNTDLWERLLKACEAHEVRFEWLRGHAGQEENERCDQLARQAAASSDLQIDPEYEKINPISPRHYSPSK